MRDIIYGAMNAIKPIGRSALITVLVIAAGTFVYTLAVSADPSDTLPTGRGIGTKDHPPQGNPNGDAGKGKPSPGNGISYHGGPVLTKGSNVYYIWYGNWGTNIAKTILPALATGLGGSAYFNINTTYYDVSGTVENPVQNAVFLGQNSQYIYPGTTKYGTSLTDAKIQQIVADVINGGQLPYDPSGVYFVLTSAEVHETSGFCTQYCGWHTHFALNGSDVKYAFVGNGDQCPSACEEQTSVSPNGNPGADGMASVNADELEEATTDPAL